MKKAIYARTFSMALEVLFKMLLIGHLCGHVNHTMIKRILLTFKLDEAFSFKKISIIHKVLIQMGKVLFETVVEGFKLSLSLRFCILKFAIFFFAFMQYMIH